MPNMSVTSATTGSDSSLLASASFFNEFADKRSWEPGWLVDFRRENWEKTKHLSTYPKDDRWRFSPKARLGYSKVSGLAQSEDSVALDGADKTGVTLQQLDRIILQDPKVLIDLPNLAGPDLGADESFLWARAFSEAGFYLRVSKNQCMDGPLFVDHRASCGGQARFHLNLIELEPFSEVTLVERISSTDRDSGGLFTNLTHIKAGEGSKINRIVIQEMNELSSFHNLENMVVGKNATLSNLAIHLGSAQTRVESKGLLTGEGADFENSSVTLGRKGQLFDQRTMQHHLAPNGKSRLTFKNALADEAKSIFSGLIKVENEAQQTNSYQTNRNLLLSNEAEADSMPGLEILANEVKCSHGATTSKIDDQELFYLLSRGIRRSVAERLIVLGFFEEVIEKIEMEDQLTQVRERIARSFTD
jgi:Fe-S cluster assembly protein SufD